MDQLSKLIDHYNHSSENPTNMCALSPPAPLPSTDGGAPTIPVQIRVRKATAARTVREQLATALTALGPMAPAQIRVRTAPVQIQEQVQPAAARAAAAGTTLAPTGTPAGAGSIGMNVWRWQTIGTAKPSTPIPEIFWAVPELTLNRRHPQPPRTTSSSTI
jgi:hypothetical protein